MPELQTLSTQHDMDQIEEESKQETTVCHTQPI